MHIPRVKSSGTNANHVALKNMSWFVNKARGGKKISSKLFPRSNCCKLVQKLIGEPGRDRTKTENYFSGTGQR